MTDREPVSCYAKSSAPGGLGLVLLATLAGAPVPATPQARMANSHGVEPLEPRAFDGKAAVLTVSIPRPGRAPRTLLGGGLVIDLSGTQYAVVNYHAVAQPGVMRVDVVGGGSSLARIAWPPRETRRDLSLLRLDHNASPSPLPLRDLVYRELTELKGAVMVGGAPGGRIAARPIALSDARQRGKRYLFFGERFAHGASGAPIFAPDDDVFVLRGIVAGNDGTFADGTKVKGGFAYTVAVIQELVSEFLRAGRRTPSPGHPIASPPPTRRP
jgi:hypothetical protein